MGSSHNNLFSKNSGSGGVEFGILTSYNDYGTMTMVMQLVSKSQFKSQMLEFLRKVEKEKKPLIITHGGKPVAKVSPYTEDPDSVFKNLRGSVLSYQDPFEQVAEQEWEVLK